MQYELVAGLEVHVQLNTDSKLFCGCSVRFGAPPNSQVCPVCMGMPGVLPVLNRRALELALRAAVALNCQISTFTKFDRKNYFYPDLPKNYQISQYDLPLSREGYLWIETEQGHPKQIGITRLHIEEDAGKLLHDPQTNTTLVDLNRCGVPLIEIVSKPEINSPQQAYLFLTTLRSILRYIGVSNCDMEKGELRCDINLSLRPKGSEGLGVKTEIKNLNSFRFVAKAISYEFQRQNKILLSGGRIVHETRLYDPTKDVTEPMRIKEEAHDYRYFPEPDLPPIVIHKEQIQKIRGDLPELPQAKASRFVQMYGITPYNARILTSERSMADFFEEACKIYTSPKTICNWMVNDLMKVLNEEALQLGQTPLRPPAFVELLGLLDQQRITAATAKEVLKEMVRCGRSPQAIVAERGLAQLGDELSLQEVVNSAISSNPQAVRDYKGGKRSALTFLVGQVMKATRGKANPKMVNQMLEERLKE
jgi:aspartyl-tRNA(Asn)/glutamyl-tRNA(Gln) amidotransferase subunit B